MPRLALLLALPLLACSDAPETGPDAAPEPDAQQACVVEPDRCERYQDAPAPCYADPCECGERQCGNESVCQEWEDTGSFGCRVLFFCECV